MQLLFKIYRWVKGETTTGLEHYIDPESPNYRDVEFLFYFWYKKGPLVYCIGDTLLNKVLLNFLEESYPDLTILYSFKDGASMDHSITNHQQMYFLIKIKHGLLIEFDSMKLYKIYYLKEYEDTEVKKILKITMKCKMEGWIKNFKSISLN